MRTLGLVLLLAGLAGAAVAAEDSYRYPAPARLVAIGDVHGAYAQLARTLKAAGLVDADLRWNGGKATLVSVGDLIDRGPDARKVLDLLMRLETEAAAAGGQVRVLSGNHEVMNLGGELRDTTGADFAAFADDESADERQRAFAAWRGRQAAATDDNGLRADFDRRFPAGWFAHRREFARDGRYGRWLFAHPIAIVVGDTAFVHGGLSPVLSGYDLARLNREFHSGLGVYLDAVATLEAAGWIDFSVSGEARADVVAARLKADAATVAPALAAAAQVVIGFDDAALFGTRGPVWYRGLAMCRSATEQDIADAALAQFGVKQIAIGHTTTPTLRPTLRLERKVLMLDTGMLTERYRGRGHAVVFDGAGTHAIDEDGKDVAFVVDAGPGGVTIPGGSDAALETALRDAAAPAGLVADGDRYSVQLNYLGHPLSAWFYPDGKREIAAYRLDRLLGLGVVPVTVARELDGKTGALQWHPEEIVGAVEAAKGSTRLAPWCEANVQVGLMLAWDALVANEGRAPASLNWDAATGTMLLSDYRRAFGTRPGLPAVAGGRPLQAGPELCRRLAGLNANALGQALADSISAKEQQALLARRDRLVAATGCH